MRQPKKYITIIMLVYLTVIQVFIYAADDRLANELQWLAMYTACIGQYNMAQTGDYALGDPHDYYTPYFMREQLTKMSGNRTVTRTFYGICFDYAQEAYNYISQNRKQFENLGATKWYIAASFGNSRQIILFDPVPQGQHTTVVNGVYVKEHSRQTIRTHGEAVNHAWLWVYGKDGTIYWIDPTWSDNNGFIWWGIVQNGEEILMLPNVSFCAVNINPTSPSFAQFSNGDANKNMSKYDQAIIDYSAAIKLDPKNAIAYNNRGVAYADKGDFNRAKTDYNQAIKLDPNYAIAYNNRGNLYSAIKDYDRAIIDFNKAIKLDPKIPIIYNNRGCVYSEKKDYTRAIADFTQAIKLDPNFANPYYNRGVTYSEKKDYTRAIADFTQAIKLEPKYVTAYYTRGYAYFNKKDYTRAIADFTQAIKLEPKYVDAYYERGYSYLKKGDYTRAIADFETVLRFDPNDSDARYLLNIARKERGW